ncbi:hypothetical protein GJV85_05055 [Sulfurimonas aquatica]|uniref:Uncharacterized protein n=1 Tax=Sulfurimonas aquatica TaxID=2672570 RepID=A0A975GCP7_9BACT|nr:hypothetical protein [Sulfurimonas aquatica]QSZ41499.1 hypothetical protein GJV85_05055 [Sulfurimonas aquatica]
MKTIFIPIFFLFSIETFANELSWVDEQVQAIKPQRSGMKRNDFSHIKDPFIFLKNEKDKEIKPSVKNISSTQSLSSSKIVTTKANEIFNLSLILNNSAMINEKWYRLGDKINGYSIDEVTSTSVLLTKQKKKILLSTKSNINKLKFRR